MSAEKSSFSAALLVVTSSEDVDATVEVNASQTSSERRERSAGVDCRKEEISARGRKPQKPSNAVTAIAISGLWLSSIIDRSGLVKSVVNFLVAKGLESKDWPPIGLFRFENLLKISS